MQSRQGLLPAVQRLLEHQDGVVSRAQLNEAGLSPRCILRLTNDWRRLARGVYLAGPATRDVPWSARVWAGVLLGGPAARAGRRTAALLDGLAMPGERFRDRNGQLRPCEAEVEILVRGTTRGPHPGYLFLRERPGVRLASRVAEPPRTRVEDTMLDLCADSDAQTTVTWLTRGCQRRLTTPDRLRERTRQRTSLEGRALVLEILDDVAAGATSNLELRALRDVFRPHGLPVSSLQHRTGTGGRVADAAVVECRVLIEFDGRVGHVEDGAFRDRERDNAHTLDGWVTLRFGWSDVTADPCGVAAQIGRLLVGLGWPGVPVTCPLCR